MCRFKQVPKEAIDVQKIKEEVSEEMKIFRKRENIKWQVFKKWKKAFKKLNPEVKKLHQLDRSDIYFTWFSLWQKNSLE